MTRQAVRIPAAAATVDADLALPDGAGAASGRWLMDLLTANEERAVVSRGGRPDLAGGHLPTVGARRCSSSAARTPDAGVTPRRAHWEERSAPSRSSGRRTPPTKEYRMRRLTLRKDTLTELTTDELALVAGGALDTRICLTDPCITRPVTGIWCLTREACA